MNIRQFFTGPTGHVLGLYEAKWYGPCSRCGMPFEMHSWGAFSWFGWNLNKATTTVCSDCGGIDPE